MYLEWWILEANRTILSSIAFWIFQVAIYRNFFLAAKIHKIFQTGTFGTSKIKFYEN